MHVCQADNPEVERYVALCAYLLAHVSVREAYAALKWQVYAQHPADIMAYNKGKDAWTKAVEPVALAWHREQAG